MLLLLSEGHANKAIAWVLGVEEATAKAHVSAILRKFGCTNRTQAALLGQRVRLRAAVEVVVPVAPGVALAGTRARTFRACPS